MKGKLLNKKLLAVLCAAALFAGLGLPASAQHKKKKEQHPVQQFRQPDRNQHEQYLAQYRQHLDQRQQVYQQNWAQLQLEKRNSQLSYQRQYAAQIQRQQRRYANARNFQNDRFFRTPFDRRYNLGGTYYETNRYGVSMLQQAIQYGYSEGYRAGVADRMDRWRSDYERSVVYQDAIYGYNGYYVPQDSYSYYFREGFRRGYEDGYNRRFQYGHHINGGYAILGGILAGILTFEMLR
jgi:hypothetical protein